MDVARLAIELDTSDIKRGSRDLNKLTAEVNNTVKVVDKGTDKLDKGFRKAADGANLLQGAFAGLIASLGARELIQAADTYTNINSKLKLVTGSIDGAKTASEQLFQVSQRTRQSFDETVTVFQRFANGTKELGISQARLLAVVETVNKAVTLSGASAQSAQAALVQLGQGLASGTLRGEELNSVLEQTPALAQALADGLGVGIGQLRAMGQAGEITAEKVITALERVATKIDSDFSQVSVTVGQAGVNLQNSFIKAVGAIDETTKATADLASSMQSLSKFIDSNSDSIAKLANAFVPFLKGGAIGLGLFAVSTGLLAIITRINPVVAGVTAIAAIIGKLNAMTEESLTLDNRLSTLETQIENTNKQIANATKEYGENSDTVKFLQERLGKLNFEYSELKVKSLNANKPVEKTTQTFTKLAPIVAKTTTNTKALNEELRKLRSEAKALDETFGAEDVFAPSNEMPKALQEYFDQRRELEEKAKQDAIDAQRELAEEQKRIAKQFEDDLINAFEEAFLRGGDFAESFRRAIEAQFAKMVLRPIVQGVVQGFGIGGGSGASSALSTAANISSLAGLSSGLGQIFGASGGFASFAAASNTFANAATFLGTSIGEGIGLSSAATASLANGASALGSAIPYVGGALLAFQGIKAISNATKGERRQGQKTITGMEGTESFNFQKGRSFLESESEALSTQYFSAINQALADLGSDARLSRIASAVLTSGKGRGGVFASGQLSTGQFFGDERGGSFADAFETALERYPFEQNRNTSIKDAETGLRLYIEQLDQAFLQALQAASGDFAQNINEYLTSLGDVELLSPEQLGAAKANVALLNQLNQAFGGMEGQLGALAGASLDATQAFLQATGGLENFNNLLSGYISAIYDESEQLAFVQDNLKRSFDRLGLVVPATRDEFQRLVEGLDIATSEGANLYAQLLELAPAFAQVTDAAERAAQESIRIAEQQAQETLRVQQQAQREYEQAIADRERSIAQARSAVISAYNAVVREAEGQIRELEQQIADIDRQFEQAAQQAKSFFDEISQGFEQFISAGQAISDVIRELVGQSVSDSQNNFQSLLTRGMAGDLDALNALPQAALALAEQQTATAATGTDADRAKGLIAAQLAALPATKSFEQQLLDKVEKSNELLGFIDINGDGAITKLEAVVSSVDGFATDLPAAIAQSLAPLFGSIDTSLDNLIDYNEFRAAFAQLGLGEKLVDIFNELDRNADGQIDREEALIGGVDGLSTAKDDRDNFNTQIDAFKISIGGFTTALENVGISIGTSFATLVSDLNDALSQYGTSVSGGGSTSGDLSGTTQTNQPVLDVYSGNNVENWTEEAYNDIFGWVGFGDGANQIKQDRFDYWVDFFKKNNINESNIRAIFQTRKNNNNYEGFSTGGYVSGPGTGTSDSIPARLSNGEFVMNARSTSRMRPMLEMMNQGRMPMMMGGDPALLREVQMMRMELENMRAETRATAINTGKSAKLMERFDDGDALLVRVEA